MIEDNMGVLVNVVLDEHWYTALPTFKLLIAIPNDLPVSVVDVPYQLQQSAYLILLKNILTKHR